MIHYLKTFVFLGGLLAIGLLLVRTLLAPGPRDWIDRRCWVVIPIVAVGLFGPNVWTYYGAILAAMVLLPRSRMEAAGLYIFLALLLPLVSYDLLIGSIYLLRVEGRLVAALGLIAAFRFKAGEQPSERGAAVLTILAMLFVIMQTIIEARTANTNATNALRNLVGAVLAAGLPYLLVATANAREYDVRRPPAYLAAVGMIVSVVAAFEMIRHWPLYQTIESHLGVQSGLSRTLALRGGLLRAAGPFLESTTCGVFLAITTIVTAAMPSLFRSRPAHLAAVAIGGLGCFATLSRNAWIGAVLGLIVVGLYRGRVGKAAGAGVLAGAAAVALIVAAPDSGLTASLVGKGDTSAANTATYRQDLFTKSLPLIRSSPWIGTPYDRVRNMMEAELTSGKLKVDYVNSYLYYAVTLGLPGLVMFMAFLFYPIVALFNTRRRLLADQRTAEAASGLFAAQVALAVMVFGTAFFERVPLFAILLIGMTRSLLARRQVAGADARAGDVGMHSPPRLVIDPIRPTIVPGITR